MTVPEMVRHVELSLEKATRLESKCDAETLAVKGFSTPTMRHLFNNLCSEPVKTYCEAGLWFGASACAAMCGNKQLTSLLLENFSQDFSERGVRESLLKSLKTVQPKTGGFAFFDQDCFTFPTHVIGSKMDVFFFDGEHGYESQYKAVPHFLPMLANPCIILVDDFNWPQVANGTRDGIASLGNAVKIEREWVITTPNQDDETWHNGLFIGVFSR